MKSYKLKKDSWHYWLASFGDEYRVYRLDDICGYIRAVIHGAFLLLLMGIIISILGGTSAFALGNLFSWLFLGYELSGVTVIYSAVITGLIGAAIVIISIEHLKEKSDRNNPGFVRLAYRKFKDKTCSKVEFE